MNWLAPLSRWVCFLRGHDVLPTGRNGFLLREWRCRRCKKRLISHDKCGDGGPFFPRAKYEGMTFTVFPSDQVSDEIVEFHKELLTPPPDPEL